MAGSDERPPFTEPLIIPCLFADGIVVAATEGVVRLIVWNEPPKIGIDVRERRIIARLALTEDSARELYAQLRWLLQARGH